MKRMGKKEIEKLINTSPEELAAHVNNLYHIIDEQQAIIDKQPREMAELKTLLFQQNEVIKELQNRINKNSKNSNKPPSKDEKHNKPQKKKPKSKEKPKQSNGSKKRKKQTAELTDNPDKTVRLSLEHCPACGSDLSEEIAHQEIRRQERDIQMTAVTTEYRAEKKWCPSCGKYHRAAFPKQVPARVQYGPKIKALIVYMIQINMCSYHRTRQFIEEIAGLEIAESTMVKINKQYAEKMDGFLETIKARIIQSDVVGFDETGMNKNCTIHWLHTAVTDSLTYMIAHRKRGKEGMDVAGILPNYQGVAVHDGWQSYKQYPDCCHASCNAHHLRELENIKETTRQQWPAQMQELLIAAHKENKNEKEKNRCLSEERKQFYANKYDEILRLGYVENPPPPKRPKGKRGRPKKPPAYNLLARLDANKTEILRFIYDSRVPFDNNTAERSFRMAKVKDKVSGTFRGVGDEVFAKIRSVVDTIRKNDYNCFEAILCCFQGLDPCMIVNYLL